MAARVLPSERANLEGDVQPLWFSFDAEQPVYPMRLTVLMKERLDVLIYVLADHRMRTRRDWGFETEFAGKLTLHPFRAEEDSDLVDLLTQRPYYVTKLLRERLRPSTMTEDLYFERAASDEPYRQVIHRTVTVYKYVYVSETESPPSKVESERPSREPSRDQLLKCLGPPALGLLAGLGLVRRRRSQWNPDQE